MKIDEMQINNGDTLVRGGNRRVIPGGYLNWKGGTYCRTIIRHQDSKETAGIQSHQQRQHSQLQKHQEESQRVQTPPGQTSQPSRRILRQSGLESNLRSFHNPRFEGECWKYRTFIFTYACHILEYLLTRSYRFV